MEIYAAYLLLGVFVKVPSTFPIVISVVLLDQPESFLGVLTELLKACLFRLRKAAFYQLRIELIGTLVPVDCLPKRLSQTTTKQRRVFRLVFRVCLG